MPCLALVALKDFHILHNLQWTVLSCIHVQLLVAGIKLCTSHGHTPCVYLGERCLYSHVCKDHSQGEGPDHNDSSMAVSPGLYFLPMLLMLDI